MPDLIKPEHLETIKQLAAGSPDAAVQRRAQLLLLYHAGHPTAAIAQAVERSTNTALYWRRRYRAEGLGIFPNVEAPAGEAAPEVQPEAPKDEKTKKGAKKADKKPDKKKNTKDKKEKKKPAKKHKTRKAGKKSDKKKGKKDKKSSKDKKTRKGKKRKT